MRRVDFWQKAVWCCAEVLLSLDNNSSIAFSLLCTAALLCSFVAQLRTALYNLDAKDQTVWSYFKFTKNKIGSRDVEKEGWFAGKAARQKDGKNFKQDRLYNKLLHLSLASSRGRPFKDHLLFSIGFRVGFTQLIFFYYYFYSSIQTIVLQSGCKNRVLKALIKIKANYFH